MPPTKNKKTSCIDAAQSKPNSAPKQSTNLKKCRKRAKKQVNKGDVRKNSSVKDRVVSKAKKSDGVNKKNKSKRRQKVDVEETKSSEEDDLDVRYGVKVPSYKSIMKHCKETEEYRKVLEENKLGPIQEYETGICDLSKQKTQHKKLHCKHLTLDEVCEALNKHLSYAAEIESEKIYCERHATFRRQERGETFEQLLDLVSSDTSTGAFTDEHILAMLKILAKKFGDKARYYLMVLLPELCLKIFMEVHNMSQDEAVKYLEEQRYNDSDLD